MKESRLFKIIYYLMNNGHSTAPLLAEKFEVSIRTIYRDIDIISSVGVPIYANQGKGGGIVIAEEFVLDKSLFSKDEKQQILQGLQSLYSTRRVDNEELLQKLGSLFRNKQASWIEVDFSDWTKGKIEQDVFDLLKEAVFQKKLVLFQYIGNDKVTKRNVAPLKLVFKSKDWYLYAYCMNRKDYRFFKLTRIRSLLMDTKAIPQDLEVLQLSIPPLTTEKMISLTLKFHKHMAFRVYDEFYEGIEEGADGYLYVHSKLPDNDMLYSYLFSFFDFVEVIEPQEVKDEMRKRIQRMYNLYNT